MATDSSSDNLNKIDHIVVLMLENHSFDNLLGWLPEKAGVDGLREEMWNPLNSVDADGIPVIEKVRVQQNAAPIKGTKYITAVPKPPVDYCLPHPDPGEGFKNTNHQLFQSYDVPNDFPPEPTNMGFVNNYVDTIVNGTYRMFGGKIDDPRTIMTAYTPEQLPVLSTLAREFAVCDRWFASVPSQTLPNRAFFHAATSCGQVNNKPQSLCDSPTIYNRLEDASRSWKIYASSPKGARNPEDSLTEDGQHFSLTRLTMVQLHDPKFNAHFRSIDQFYADAKSGDLPDYCFLEPQYSGAGQNDQHPPSDLRSGEKLIADVYKAVRSSPQWEKTLLIVTYDEHGGCFDHVPPPNGATPPDKDKPPGQFDFLFNRFGVRVATVLISPHIKKGSVCRPGGWTPFDHTSVIKTVRNRFGLTEQLTERDGRAPDVSCVLTLKDARQDCPESVAALSCDETEDPGPNKLHELCKEILMELTNEHPGEDESVFDYLVRAFSVHFCATLK